MFNKKPVQSKPAYTVVKDTNGFKYYIPTNK